jgi:hypothetical protein
LIDGDSKRFHRVACVLFIEEEARFVFFHLTGFKAQGFDRKNARSALNLSPVPEAPVQQACPQAAQPGLCRERARGEDGDGRGPGTGVRVSWS